MKKNSTNKCKNRMKSTKHFWPNSKNLSRKEESQFNRNYKNKRSWPRSETKSTNAPIH